MSPVKFDDFMRLANIFYLSMGIKPYQPVGSWKWLLNFLYYLNFINLFVTVILESAYVFVSFKNGEHYLESFINLPCIGFCLICLFKLISIWAKKDELQRLIREFQVMFPLSTEMQMGFKVRSYLRESSLITSYFSFMYMLTVWTFNLVGILRYVIAELLLGWEQREQILPYFILVPWDWHGHWSFYVLYAFLTLAGYTAAAGQISSDVLLTSVTTQLVMHYDYLALNIEGYAAKASTENGWSEKNAQLDRKFLNEIIGRHEKLLGFSETINDIFGASLLFNFVSSTFVICMAGFMMTVGASYDVLFKFFIAFISTTSQVYLICYYGQRLIDSSVALSEAIYSHDWINADVRYKKMLILITQRAQKPAVLRATRFVTIQRGTMTEIMQISYKFFAIMRHMYTRRN